jgi:transcriptional regulator with XRE-family HTH domain
MPLMRKANRVRELRKSKGLSGYDLAILSGVIATSVYLIERGAKKPLRYEMDKIADALGLPVDVVFPREMAFSREVVECRNMGGAE